MTYYRKALLASSIAMGVSLSACGGGGSGGPSLIPPPPTPTATPQVCPPPAGPWDYC